MNWLASRQIMIPIGVSYSVIKFIDLVELLDNDGAFLLDNDGAQLLDNI